MNIFPKFKLIKLNSVQLVHLINLVNLLINVKIAKNKRYAKVDTYKYILKDIIGDLIKPQLNFIFVILVH